MAKKKNRSSQNTGWARTKDYPHKRHPSFYRKNKKDNDKIEYLTFTHSKAVEMPNGSQVHTVPMGDNISKFERADNKRKGLKPEDNLSYVYPKVFCGKRSALGAKTDEFSFANNDEKERAYKMFDMFPTENVPHTGGKNKFRKQKKKPH